MNKIKTHMIVDVSKYPEDTTRFQLPSVYFQDISELMKDKELPMDFKVPKHMHKSVAKELRDVGFEVATGVGMFANKINVSRSGGY